LFKHYAKKTYERLNLTNVADEWMGSNSNHFNHTENILWIGEWLGPIFRGKKKNLCL